MVARKRYAVCFVDDDPDDLRRFKKHFSTSYFIGVGTNFPRALQDLRKTHAGKPDLFVLDMYFPNRVNTEVERHALDETWEKLCVANNEMSAVLAKMEQTTDGGRRLAQHAKSQKRPFVFFTRKGDLAGAIEAYENIGALSVIKKPDPPIPSNKRSKLQIKAARDEAMKKLSEQIREKIDQAITRAIPSRSGQAFVAMSYAGYLKAAFDTGIEPAVRSAGYSSMIIRKKEHANKIDDEIIAEIRKSTFLIADLTCHRGGVYYEAGVAMGLGVPVIWTCHIDDFGSTHFDVRQFNCICWTTPDQLARQLEKRILQVNGRGPFQAESARTQARK
jgi:CheY-like chemotaxis protein